MLIINNGFQKIATLQRPYKNLPKVEKRGCTMAAIISKQNYDPMKMLDHVQVLIVNQSREVAQLLKNVLDALGFRQSYSVDDAVEAIRYLRQMRINILITDSQLRIMPSNSFAGNSAAPILSGADFVRSLRQSNSSPSPYIIAVMLAQEMDKHQLLRARDSGVNGVVLRPLDASQLATAIRELIDAPRRFVVSEAYKGPCRRKQKQAYRGAERRRKDLCIVRNNGKS